MRVKARIFSTFFALFGTIIAPDALATTFPNANQPLSKYGQIQNVQNYSSNPFWTPNSPYNQRMPQPVYVMGADLNTGDCQRTVSALIASQCALENNCIGVTLADIRPTIMLQLSRLPGHNYATACAGYIDSEFNNYVKNYSNAGPSNKTVSFPSATTPNPSVNQADFQIENPYAPKMPTWNGDPWFQDMIDRKQELQNLQSQNGTGGEKIAKADFPTTAADLSFSERMENASSGYAPYAGKSAYEQLKNIESEEEYIARMREMDKLKLSPADFCKKWPSDSSCQTNTKNIVASTNNTTGGENSIGGNVSNQDRQQLINQIIAAFSK